jgi:formylglycine-generating enzyme
MNRDYSDHLLQRNADMDKDAIILPTGDGVAIGIPFVDIKDFALHLSKTILAKVDVHNQATQCRELLENKWCNCHDGFFLRCGISEGTTILYRDLTQRFNLAGATINLAARVMNLACPNQIFLTKRAYEELTEYAGNSEDIFHEYLHAPIKHGGAITVYQYVTPGVPGLDIALQDDLLHSSIVKASPPPAAQPKPQATPKKSPVNAVPKKTIEPAPLSPELPPLVSQLAGRMHSVSGGTFIMGLSTTRQFQVNITRPFLIDPYLVTQELYNQVTGSSHPCYFKGERHPVDSVSWMDAVRFCNRLSDISGFIPVYHIQDNAITADIRQDGYRLPTEAEWEYCCRGCGNDIPAAPLDKIAWFNRNAEETTHPVGELDANPCGLHDMLGNLWEWCHDWFVRDFPENAVDDYAGPTREEMERVLRGGSWIDIAPVVTPYYRHRAMPTLRHQTHGFRIVRTISPAILNSK